MFAKAMTHRDFQASHRHRVVGWPRKTHRAGHRALYWVKICENNETSVGFQGVPRGFKAFFLGFQGKNWGIPNFRHLWVEPFRSDFRRCGPLSGPGRETMGNKPTKARLGRSILHVFHMFSHLFTYWTSFSQMFAIFPHIFTIFFSRRRFSAMSLEIGVILATVSLWHFQEHRSDILTAPGTTGNGGVFNGRSISMSMSLEDV